jgi:elongation factor Ts
LQGRAPSERRRHGAGQGLLREKGIAGAAKRAGREADQGSIEVLVEGSAGAIVELNCETDFVAKGMCSSRPSPRLPRSSSSTATPTSGRARSASETVDDFVKGLSGTLGEKIEVGRVIRFEAVDGLIDGYKHIQNERGVVGVLVELAGVDANDAKAREVAHDIALHIASAAPRFVSRDDVPADEVERERDVLQKQTAEEGKPEQAWPKIVEGKLNGFFKTVALVEQSFVKDQKQTIGALVQSLGDGVSVRQFARVKIGED